MNPSPKDPTEFDKHVGIKLQALRLQLGLSREQLASKLGVTHQQIQKYEQGRNRIAFGRIMDICAAMSVTIGYFLYEPIISEQTHNARLLLEASRNFSAIKDRKVQEAAVALLCTLKGK